jgi:hypothetical protein
MADQVLHRYSNRLSRFGIAHSVAGDGLLDRMRTTTFALLGITAAVGLAFVALIASQGWPALPLGPILGPRTHEAVGDATAVTGDPAVAGKGGRRAASGSVPGSPGPAGVPNAANSGSAVSGSHRFPPAPPASVHGGPSSGKGTRGAPAPVEQPAPTPAPATTTTPVPTESAPEAPSSSPPPVTAGMGNGNGKGHAYGRDGDQGEGKSDGATGHHKVKGEGESPTVKEDTPEAAESSHSSSGPYGDGHGSDHGHGHGDGHH